MATAEFKALQDILLKKKQELSDLQRQLKSAEQKLFADLPKQCGLNSIDELIQTLAAYASPRLRVALQSLFDSNSREPNRSLEKSEPERTRGRITETIREQIIAELKAEKKTAEQIAREFAVSTPSVNLIKQKAGLTQRRRSTKPIGR